MTIADEGFRLGDVGNPRRCRITALASGLRGNGIFRKDSIGLVVLGGRGKMKNEPASMLSFSNDSRWRYHSLSPLVVKC